MSTVRVWPALRTRVLGKPIPLTLWAGLLCVIACEVLLFSDVWLSHRGALHTDEAAMALMSHEPRTAYARAARFVAVYMTPLVWAGYVMFLDGVLTWQQGASPIRRRPNHFALLCLASVLIWCLFDWVNFDYIRAWHYIEMGINSRWQRYWGYVVAFAAVAPGMLMSGQMFLNLRAFQSLRSSGWRMPGWAKWAALAAGVAMFVLPLVLRDPKGNFTLWLSLIFLLDPINLKLGRPSAFRDWQNGWYGRTLAACAGGLLCGLLWEFWNYWALAKWVYHLPFMGTAEHVKYFEMPIFGLLGFIPFGLECWVMFQTLRIPFDGLAEPLPDERTLI